MPAYSEMAAPVTDLLKASSGAQKVNWSVECETAFNRRDFGASLETL